VRFDSGKASPYNVQLLTPKQFERGKKGFKKKKNDTSNFFINKIFIYSYCFFFVFFFFFFFIFLLFFFFWFFFFFFFFFFIFIFYFIIILFKFVSLWWISRSRRMVVDWNPALYCLWICRSLPLRIIIYFFKTPLPSKSTNPLILLTYAIYHLHSYTTITVFCK